MNPSRGVAGPHRIVLEAQPSGAAASTSASADGAPPVRIFLGTEPAQYRAERIFLWSVERCRDPRRRYEIFLMRDLPGYRRLGWTTRFTNHRFAVPHYAGGCGRAIYNDVDQIYLRDPGELFDLDMGSHGFLAISERETSVMLLDCERMARVWTLEEARRRHKRTLIGMALAEPGLYGPLHPGWNCRDEDEYDADAVRCYHFTTLHTQPWRPFPERFVYHPHPHRELWEALEREADEAGYRVFDRRRPSPRWGRVSAPAGRAVDPAELLPALRAWLQRTGARSARCFATGSPPAELPALPGVEVLAPDDLAKIDGEPSEAERADAVVCLDGLERLPDDDVSWVVGELFRRARRSVFLAAPALAVRRSLPGSPPRGGVRSRAWWLDLLRVASRERPDVSWELWLDAERGGLRVERGGPHPGGGPPRVWLLAAEDGAELAEARALAERLGWPCEERSVRSRGLERLLRSTLGSGAAQALVGASGVGLSAGTAARLAPPWPDLAISAGDAAAPAARWLARRARGRLRSVQLDGRGASPADAFDLVATPASLGALGHPRRLETALPLEPPPEPGLEAAEEAERLLPSEGPAWRLLVLEGDGGTQAVSALAGALAGRCARDGARLAVALHGALPPRVETALADGAAGATVLPRLGDGARDRARLRAWCARSAEVVAAADHPAWLAALCAEGAPLPELWTGSRGSASGPGWRARLAARAFARPANDRGTTRPQRGSERWLSRLLAAGVLLPPPEAARLRAHLVETGRALCFDREDVGARSRQSEGSRLAARIEALLGARAKRPHEGPARRRAP